MASVTWAASIVLWIFCAVIIRNTASSPRLKVDPSTIEVGLTKSLTINCSYPATRSHAVAFLASLKVYKAALSGFQEVGSIRVVNRKLKIKLANTQVFGSGQLSDDSDSYIILSWSHPSAKLAGEYTCVATVYDVDGNQDRETTATTVMVEIPPPIQELYNCLSYSEKLKERILELERSNAARSQEIASLWARQPPLVSHMSVKQRPLQTQTLRPDRTVEG